jgi:hypothetical protein
VAGMFLIRSIAQAQSNRRSEAVALMKEFSKETEKEFGLSESRVLTASVGPADSTIVTERVVKSLAEFEQSIEKINAWSGMQRYGQKLSELFIGGSHRFEIYRIQ